MKKSIILLTMAALLVSCGKTPKSVMKSVSDSQMRVAEALVSEDSDREKEDVIDDEINDMKDLRKDVRSCSWTVKERYVALHEQQKDSDAKAAYLTIDFCKNKLREDAYKKGKSPSDSSLCKKLEELKDAYDAVGKELETACSHLY